MKLRIHLSAVIALFFLSIHVSAQDRPIGYWRSHMPYSNATGVATDGVTLYTITDESFFTYNVAGNEITPYSKVEGMSDVSMSNIAFDATTGMTVITYKNSNIDLFTDGTFYNIPDIRLKSINGIKDIYNVYTEDGMAYLSAGFGVVVINLEKKESKETYSFTQNGLTFAVKGFTSEGGIFYAVTAKGLYKANKNNPNLQAFSSWQLVDGNPGLTSIVSRNGKVFASSSDTVYSLESGALVPVYSSGLSIIHLDKGKNGIWINELNETAFTGRIKLLDNSYNIIDSFNAPGKPVQTVELADNSIWVADAFNGLWKAGDGRNFTKPQGPSALSSYDILSDNGEVWVAHGAYSDIWQPQFNTKGFSRFYQDKWTHYNNTTYPVFSDSITDIVVLAKDPASGTLYAGSFRSGLFMLNADGSYHYLKQDTILEAIIGDPNAYLVSGLTVDLDGNLWISQAGAPHDLVVRTKEGSWYRYAGAGAGSFTAGIMTDDYNQKWYALPKGQGVAIYNDNHTPDNPNDDSYKRMGIEKGLPSNNTFCIVKDKQGALWIGTDNGIGIVNCPDQAIQGTCDVEKRIVQYDQFPGYLFQSEKVLTIAVDGANRKWVGTMNGVWLLSPEADKIIYRFTADNSPLPSNTIRKISVDPVTGDVYIGTDLGLVSYRSTATDAGDNGINVLTFPNPVPSGYTGTIAVRGLPENADVRITDIAGRLIYRTQALGGQAVWGGTDYTGRRPQSGVYLIFITNKDGSQTHVGKMVFME